MSVSLEIFSPIASYERGILCLRTSSASSLISSGITYSRHSIKASTFADWMSAIEARGDAPQLIYGAISVSQYSDGSRVAKTISLT